MEKPSVSLQDILSDQKLDSNQFAADKAVILSLVAGFLHRLEEMIALGAR